MFFKNLSFISLYFFILGIFILYFHMFFLNYFSFFIISSYLFVYLSAFTYLIYLLFLVFTMHKLLLPGNNAQSIKMIVLIKQMCFFACT